jgi:hypothetical protein
MWISVDKMGIGYMLSQLKRNISDITKQRDYKLSIIHLHPHNL